MAPSPASGSVVAPNAEAREVGPPIPTGSNSIRNAISGRLCIRFVFCTDSQSAAANANVEAESRAAIADRRPDSLAEPRIPDCGHSDQVEQEYAIPSVS